MTQVQQEAKRILVERFGMTEAMAERIAMKTNHFSDYERECHTLAKQQALANLEAKS